jgi:hypothetical protein
MEMVRAAGGDLKIEDPVPAERAAWRPAIYAARRSEIREAGWLMYIGRDSGNLHLILPHFSTPHPRMRYPALLCRSRCLSGCRRRLITLWRRCEMTRSSSV